MRHVQLNRTALTLRMVTFKTNETRTAQQDSFNVRDGDVQKKKKKRHVQLVSTALTSGMVMFARLPGSCEIDSLEDDFYTYIAICRRLFLPR